MNEFVKTYEENLIKKKKDKQKIGIEQFIEEDIHELISEEKGKSDDSDSVSY